LISLAGKPTSDMTMTYVVKNVAAFGTALPRSSTIEVGEAMNASIWSIRAPARVTARKLFTTRKVKNRLNSDIWIHECDSTP